MDGILAISFVLEEAAPLPDFLDADASLTFSFEVDAVVAAADFEFSNAAR